MIPPSTRWVSQRIDGGSRRSIKRVPQQCGKRRCLWITNRQKKIRTLWHCDSQHHLACHILCEKNHAIFWGEFNEMFHYKPAFLLGSERGIPISLEEILPIIHPRILQLCSHPKNSQRVEVGTYFGRVRMRASESDCMFAAANVAKIVQNNSSKNPQVLEPPSTFWCLFLKKNVGMPCSKRSKYTKNNKST